jgi:hypothetical protein
MEKVTFIKVADIITNELTEYAIIERGNNEYSSMLKSTYDAMQAEQSTPIVIDEAKTK